MRDGATYCAKHRAQRQREQDAQRGSAAARGYNSRWQKARATYLQAHPLCAEHQRRGQTVEASVVDHIVPHRGNQERFWDRANWQALCNDCHVRWKQRLERATSGTTPA